MSAVICKVCGEPMTGTGVWETLVGYMSPPGHKHDDNCLTQNYICPNDHVLTLSVQNRCPTPGCDWVGKKTCFCHDGEKLERWPEEEASEAPKDTP